MNLFDLICPYCRASEFNHTEFCKRNAYGGPGESADTSRETGAHSPPCPPLKQEVKRMEEQSKINWGEFEVKGGEDWIVLETGKKYELGFCSIKQSSMEVVDKERTAEGKVEIKKTIPTLILGVDLLAGKPAKTAIQVTSKKLIQTIKTYFERDMLFTRIFQLEKSGSGFQTTYQLIALQDKQKTKDVEAFL
jgi:hypothetical protein